jgi:hypothetical protein
MSNVKSIAIGVGAEGGGGGGSGTLYFDDIRLYTPRCILARRPADYALLDYAPEGTPNGDCKVDYKELAIMARDWATGDRTVNPQAISVGPVAWYKFDGNANDSSGNGNNGTENGGPFYSVGQVGQAIDLDGVDDYVSTGKTASQLGIDGGNAKTTMAWVYTRAFNNGGIWEVGANVNSQDWSLRTYTDATYPTDRWRVQRFGYPTYDFDVTYPSLNEWVHFALVYDGTAGGNESRLYADGIVIGTQTAALNTADSPKNFVVGRWDVNYFNGLVDDLRVYSYALTEGQVLTSAGMGATYIPLTSPANVYDPEPVNQRKVNFKDYSKLVLRWLEENEWP